MGMQNKIMKAYIKGCQDTWDLLDAAISEVPGIGPKTQEKLLEAIQEHANKQVEETQNISQSERKKLDHMIDSMAK